MAEKRNSVTIGLNPNNTFGLEGGATKTTHDESGVDERITIAKEFRNAKEKLKATGKLPISIDNKCLMSMQDGRDTSIVLKLFKTACLSYQPTDVTYREHKISRPQLLHMRKELLEKV